MSLENRFDKYQEQVRLDGATPSERYRERKDKTFSFYFKHSINKALVQVNNDGMFPIVFQDHSQSNNKDLSDDKYIILENKTPIHVGDYILWRDSRWLVFTKEFKTVASHQQAKVKEANESIKWIRDGEIINNENGWYSYAQSQTLYTLGVAEANILPIVDSKMIMTMQNNKDTRDLRMDERVFIGERVYKIKFTDTVSRSGLISFLLDEATIGPYDNVELGVSDYYRFYGKDDDITNHPDEIPSDGPSELVLTGEANPKISREYVYEVEGGEIEQWLVMHDQSEEPFYITEKTSTSIRLKFKDDYRYVGQVLNIVAKTADDKYTSLAVSLSVKY